MEQKSVNNDLHPNKKQKKADQPDKYINPKEEDKQPQQAELSSTLSQHIGEYTIYIQESPYGFRHSKYAADYRREWGKMKHENVAEPLVFQKNVATMKLVPNPNYADEGPKDDNNINNTTNNSLQGAKKQVDPQKKAVYVTMPSLTKFDDGSKDLADASYHSEPQVGKALIFGHNKGFILDKKDKTESSKESKEESIYNKITENGKYLIKWVYSEREPCLPGLYEHSCQQYLEGLAKIQFRNLGIPIEVYYTNAYIDHKKHEFKAEPIKQEQVTASRDYPLSSEPSIHQERHKDLQKDISLGKTVIHTPTISENDLRMQQQNKQIKIDKLKVHLNMAEKAWRDRLIKVATEYEKKQLAEAKIDLSQITFADREKVYACNGTLRAFAFDEHKTVEQIVGQLNILTGASNAPIQPSRNRENLMKALQEEKIHDDIKGLKELERDIKRQIAQVMKDEVKTGNLTYVIREEKALSFIAEGQKLLSQINNTICDYRQCIKNNQKFPIEGKLQGYMKNKEELFEKLKPKENKQVETKNDHADLKSDDQKKDDQNNDDNNRITLKSSS